MTETSPDSRPSRALAALRCLAALTMFIHGTYRISTDGFVAGFGGALDAYGIPFGPAVAWMITLWECTGSLLLASGWKQRWVALGFAAELSAGIILVHRPHGWFVVGGGRNGMEYSVVLICILLAVAWAEPRFASRAPAA